MTIIRRLGAAALLSAQALRFIGSEDERLCAVRPAQFAIDIFRAFIVRAYRENAALAFDHNIARVVERCADQIYERIIFHALADKLSARARLAETATGEDEPVRPEAFGNFLICARPKIPIVT